MAKVRYDSQHAPVDLKVGDKAYFRLHHGYTIPGITNHKLSNQRAGPFKIMEKVGNLAYRLRLPPVMKIWSVVSIAQIEPHHGPDPYG